MKKTLNIGDTVSWRGAWGTEPAKKAKVTDMQLVPAGEKYGKDVKSAKWTTVEADKIVVNLDNGHWAYGYQLKQVEQKKKKKKKA